jgi:hypothetical protein
LPSTNNAANFLRCALLLIGIDNLAAWRSGSVLADVQWMPTLYSCPAPFSRRV